MTGPTTAVVGGGVIGLACARALAGAGGRVSLYDAPSAGRPSDVAAGMLAPICELDYGEAPLLALSRDSVARWPRLAAELADETGIDVGLRREGTLLLATEPDDLPRLHRRARLWDEHGLPYAELTGRECRSLEPALSRRIRAGLRVDGDLSVDNRMVLRALMASVRRRGVDIRHERVALHRDADTVTGVRTPHGIDRADVVVVAAGVWSAPLLQGAGMGAGIRPVKGQQLRLHRETPVITRTLRGRVDEVDIYLVPRSDGTVVVGGTSEDVGFDLRRTPRAVLDLLGAACAVVPELRDHELVEHDVGLRPATDDNGPFLGTGAAPGLVVATGHYRHGFLLTPVTAEVVRAAVLDEPLPEAALPFSPAAHERKTA